MKSSFALLIIFGGLSFSAFGQAHVSNELLQGTNADDKVDVIVRFKEAPDEAKHQSIGNLGGTLKAALAAIKGGLYTMPAARVQDLSADPDIVSVTPNRRVRMLLDNTTAAVNAWAGWNAGLDGSGIGVAVIDSGISYHDDLQGPNGYRVLYHEQFVTVAGSNDFGHGEHVAGILAGNGADSACWNCTRLFKGVAPNANIIDLQVLDENGEGTDDGVIAAIGRAIQLAPVYNIKVINLSLGRPAYEKYGLDPLCAAVEAAWRAGIVVVVAAGNGGRDNPVGNNGYGTIMSPGNDPYVITVGAMKAMGTPQRGDDLIASYSSKGPTPADHIAKPDLVAPGNLVVSLMGANENLPLMYPGNLVPLNYYQQTSNTSPSTSYFTLSGTSMATPVVSGAAALLLQSNPGLTPDQIKGKLMISAYKNFPKTSSAYDPATNQTYTSEYDIFTVGAGYLDIQAALADNTPLRNSALSPPVYYLSWFNVAIIGCDSTTVCDNNTSWGVSGPWGPQSVWGTQSVWPDQSVWADQSLWANQSVWDTQSVWADQSIWADQTISATATTDPNMGREIVGRGEK